MPDSPIVPRLLADDIARSPIRSIMALADRDNIIALGLDPDDVISFAGGWVNHAAPEPMRAAYARIVDDASAFHDCGGYGPTAGLAKLREALARLETDIYGTSGLDASNVIVGQSSTQLTYCLFTALLDPGETLLTFDPAYANYEPQLAVLGDGRRIAKVPVLDPTSWRTFDDIEQVVARIEDTLARHRPKLMLFSSPDNPTGAIVPDAAFDGIVAAARRHDCMVAVDYAYRAQYFADERPRHFSPDPAAVDHVIAIHSNSKWCRGLGRRLGWVVARPDIVEALGLVQQSVILCPDTVHQAALAEYLDGALADGSLADYLETTRRLYRDAARHLSRCIDQYLGFRHVTPEGGLYTVVDVGTESEAFVGEVLAATGVVLVPGSGFGDTLSDAVRISFGPLVNDPERVEEGFSRLRDHLAGSASGDA